MSRRFLFVLPRGARGGRPERRLRSLLDLRPELSACSRILAVGDAAEAAGMLAHTERADGARTPVAAGGDGTVGLVARALWAADRADRGMAVLPLGTGNAIAHALGVGSLENAVRALETGAPRAWDVLETDRPDLPLVLATLSVGIESRIIAGIARGSGPPILGAAVGAASGAGRRMRGLSLCVDGRALLHPDEPVCNAGLYNVPCYAFGWTVFPTGSVRDGRGEAAVDRSQAAYWRRVLGRGTRGSGGTSWREAVLDSPVPLQADGELVPPGRLRVRVVAGGLRILTPEPA